MSGSTPPSEPHANRSLAEIFNQSAQAQGPSNAGHVQPKGAR